MRRATLLLQCECRLLTWSPISIASCCYRCCCCCVRQWWTSQASRTSTPDHLPPGSRQNMNRSLNRMGFDCPMQLRLDHCSCLNRVRSLITHGLVTSDWGPLLRNLPLANLQNNHYRIVYKHSAINCCKISSSVPLC